MASASPATALPSLSPPFLFLALDTSREEQSRTRDLIGVDVPDVLFTEWAKMAAWRTQGRLATLIDQLEFTSDSDAVIAELESAVADATRAIEDMRSGEGMPEHYGNKPWVESDSLREVEDTNGFWVQT